MQNYSKSNDNSNKKKVGIIIGSKTNKYSASSYIRLLSPLNELSSEYSIQIIDNESHSQFYKDLNENIHFDIIIIQRDIFDLSKMNLEFINNLFLKIKKKDIITIFDLDDDLLDIDETHVSYERFAKINNILKVLLTKSDIITVSTTTLKEKIIKYNKNIVVIPNTLMNLFNFNPHENIKNLNMKNTIKIGYFGTRTHSKDIKLIETAISNVKNINDRNIILEVVGVCSEDYEWIKKIELPYIYKNHLNINEKMKNIFVNVLNKMNIIQTNLPYNSFIKWMMNELDWDIAIAPLEDNNINRSKSNLKYLEYTALNIPGIYSNIGPYVEIGKKNTGIVVNNTTEEWENALINLIEDNKLYETLLKNAYEDIEKNYLVKNSSSIWKKILENSSNK